MIASTTYLAADMAVSADAWLGALPSVKLDAYWGVVSFSTFCFLPGCVLKGTKKLWTGRCYVARLTSRVARHALVDGRFW